MKHRRAPCSCIARAIPVAIDQRLATPVISAVFPSSSFTRRVLGPRGWSDLLERDVAVLAVRPVDALVGEHLEAARDRLPRPPGFDDVVDVAALRRNERVGETVAVFFDQLRGASGGVG